MTQDRLTTDWPLLQGVPPADIARFLERARRRTFEAGEIVFHAGDPGDAVHLVEAGRFAAQITTPYGDQATINVLGAGDAFGELALLTAGQPRSATIVSLEEGRTLSVHQIDFRRMRAERPEMSDVIISLMANRIRRLSSHLVEALSVQADARVRRRLLDLADLYRDESGRILIPLTQEDLASLAGTSRATVNRVLRQEEATGSVRLGRGRTEILDAELLGRLA